MDQERRARLENSGVNYEAGLNRFMNNEALYERFLLKFPSDESYQSLSKALEADDCEAAFQAAHTLKGVAGNLSLDALFSAVAVQTEALRNGQLAEGKAHLPAVTAAYEAVIEALK